MEEFQTKFFQKIYKNVDILTEIHRNVFAQQLTLIVHKLYFYQFIILCSRYQSFMFIGLSNMNPRIFKSRRHLLYRSQIGRICSSKWDPFWVCSYIQWGVALLEIWFKIWNQCRLAITDDFIGRAPDLSTAISCHFSITCVLEKYFLQKMIIIEPKICQSLMF